MSASAAGPSSSGQPVAGPRPTASGKQPEVAVGGVRTARVIVPDDDFSAKPFNADNGTTIVLWVKMPARQGLIEIDEDASVVQSVSDDKGSNIGGKFGNFPKAFKDGSGGIIEIESSGFAAPGATALFAERAVTTTVATGTRKTRVGRCSCRTTRSSHSARHQSSSPPCRPRAIHSRSRLNCRGR